MDEQTMDMTRTLMDATSRMQGELMVSHQMLAEIAIALPANRLPALLSRLETVAEQVLASMDDAPVSQATRDGAALASAAVLTHIRAYRP